MEKKYDYIIVGAGHCGLVLAKELVKKNKRVLILEKGGFLNHLGTIWPAFLFYDRQAISYSKQGVIIYRAFGVGGTSVVGCGNAVMPSDEEIARIGIDFKSEFADAKKESFVRDGGLVIGKASARIMQEANKLGFTMIPMPKFNITGKCIACGNCYYGCNYASKWSSRYCLKDMDKDKYDLITGFSADKVISENGKAVGVEGVLKGLRHQRFFAPKIVLSAGGIGTPIILQKSGLAAGDNLYVDLYNVTYGVNKEYNQREELTMAAVCPKFHQSDGFVMAPFVDNWWSLSTNVAPRHIPEIFRINRLMGIMTKINDDSTGRVNRDGRVDKAPTENDLKKLKKGSDIAKEILIKSGCNQKSLFVTRPAGAHPGGTAAIGKVVNNRLETQIKNLYVCDCSVLPFAPGLPPMLILLALTKWFAKDLER